MIKIDGSHCPSYLPIETMLLTPLGDSVVGTVWYIDDDQNK